MKRDVEFIIIHCADTPDGRETHADDIRRWHTGPKPRGRGWRTPGYHDVVCIDGSVEELVPLDDDQYIESNEVSNGVRGYNSKTCHICMPGTTRFTPAQWDSLKKLVQKRMKQYPLATVLGHRDLDRGKTCPGFNVAVWRVAGFKPLPEHILENCDE